MKGIALNEDDSHFFFSRTPEQMTEAGVDAWVDTYVGTQVRELMLCTNAMRCNVSGMAKQAIYDGFDPNAGDEQPYFAGVAPAERAGVRRWAINALLLHQRGIDPYARWIAGCRSAGISPWISMRMNDVHNVDRLDHPLHDRFWREHPEFLRVPWRFVSWPDRAFDYGRPEVREYQMAFVRQLIDRYDVDGLELDWMRFGYHFWPGHEAEGCAQLTEFTAEVRRLLDARARELGHPIRLAARVPSRPDTACGLGMNAVTWARGGLVDLLVITPFWETIETDMPVELWKELLAGTSTLLAAGLELNVRPYPGAASQVNTLETVRGAAASLLDRGADRLYLFNYMDCDTAMESQEEYHQVLREAGSLETMAGKVRRHVVTYPDVCAPGEARAAALAGTHPPRGLAEFRLATGPAPLPAHPPQVPRGGPPADGDLQVRVNGEACAAAGPMEAPAGPTHAWIIPSGVLHRGYNVVEARNASGVEQRIVWVEVGVGDVGANLGSGMM